MKTCKPFLIHSRHIDVSETRLNKKLSRIEFVAFKGCVKGAISSFIAEVDLTYLLSLSELVQEILKRFDISPASSFDQLHVGFVLFGPEIGPSLLKLRFKAYSCKLLRMSLIKVRHRIDDTDILLEVVNINISALFDVIHLHHLFSSQAVRASVFIEFRQLFLLYRLLPRSWVPQISVESLRFH